MFDFLARRDGLQSLVAELDQSVLLPDRHRQIRVEQSEDGSEVTARFENRRWMFPAEDCRILPVENTTAELIARWLSETLCERLGLRSQTGLSRLRISVEENFGQWADCWTEL
ncbi:MAG: 6-carboxytetrahydropterin synthase [Planctomyces sp.]